MTRSWRHQEGERGNRRVPPKERADAQHRCQRPAMKQSGLVGETGFLCATEPQAREVVA
jgi:hypothetical protein